MMHDTTHTTFTTCPTCQGELEIEWAEVYSVVTTGQRFCLRCEDGSKHTEHDWRPEVEEQVDTELVSLKTYCFHPMTREQAGELLSDLAAAAAERRAEGE